MTFESLTDETRKPAVRVGSVVLLLPLCLAATGLLACGPAAEEAGPAGDAEEEAAAPGEPASAAGEPGALEAETWLDDVSVGHSLDPQGAIQVEGRATEFAVGDVVYVSMAVGDAPPEAAVHVVFYGGGGEKVAEDAKKVPAEARYLYFDSGDTRNWEPGTYRVEVAVEGEVVAEREVTLAAPPTAPVQ